MGAFSSGRFEPTAFDVDTALAPNPVTCTCVATAVLTLFFGVSSAVGAFDRASYENTAFNVDRSVSQTARATAVLQTGVFLKAGLPIGAFDPHAFPDAAFATDYAIDQTAVASAKFWADGVRFTDGSALQTEIEAAAFWADAARLTASDAESLTTQAILNTAVLFSGTAAQTLTATGAIRFGDVEVWINGIDRSLFVDRDTIDYTVYGNDQQSTCSYEAFGFVPNEGDTVRIDRVVADEFVGRITSRTITRGRLNEGRQVYLVNCGDHTYDLNGILITKLYRDWTGTAIALDLAAQCPGLTTRGVAGGLPSVDASGNPIVLQFKMTPLPQALQQLCDAILARWRIDLPFDLHLFLTANAPVATTLSPSNRDWRSFTLSDTITNLANRVLFEGWGGTALINVGIGVSEFPVSDTLGWYAPQSGKLIADDEILSYTSVTLGGAVATVQVSPFNAPGAPIGAPNVVASPGGPLAGTYLWAVAFGTAAGETLVGPPTYPRLCAAVTPPATLVGITSAGFGPLSGAYGYATTFVTSLGETTASLPASRTANPIGGVANPLTLVSVGSGPQGVNPFAPGIYSYVYTCVTPLGETLPSAATPYTMVDIAPPSTLIAADGGAPGVLVPGAVYSYVCTFVTPYGETVASNPTSYTPPLVAVAGIDLGTPSWATFGGLYGTGYRWGFSVVTATGESPMYVYTGSQAFAFVQGAPGGPSLSGVNFSGGRLFPGTYYYALSLYSDDYGESPLSGYIAVSVQSSGAQVVINLPIRAGGRGSGLRLYRSRDNITYKLVFDNRNNGLTTCVDSFADTELGAMYPVQGMPLGLAFQAALLASSEPGVLARRVYRTKAGGAEFYLVAEIQNNTNEWTVVDSVKDAALSVRNPVAPTAGKQVTLTVPTGPPGILKRNIYRSKANGTQRFLVGTLPDNTSTTFQDNIADTAVGVAAPGVSTAGSCAVQVTQALPQVNIPLGPTGTIARKLYRTAVGASQYGLIATLPDNTTTTFVDTIPDPSRGPTPPLTSSAGGEAHTLTVPVGPAGTVAVKIYRTISGGADLKFLGQVANGVTTLTDAVLDANLGAPPPVTNTAGAAQALLSNLPVGPASVTQRILYRTKAGGSDLFYVGSVNDNLPTTTFVDTVPDTGLGRLALSTSSAQTAANASTAVAALPGATTLTLDFINNFPGSGWVEVGGQIIRYNNISGLTLAGIPAPTAIFAMQIMRPDTARAVYPTYDSSAVFPGTAVVVVQTLFTPPGAPTLVTGQSVTISGTDQSLLNGTFPIWVVSPNRFVYEVSDAALSLPSSQGTSATPLSWLIYPPGSIVASVPIAARLRVLSVIRGVTGLVNAIPAGGAVNILVQVDDLTSQAGPWGLRTWFGRDTTLKYGAALTRATAELQLRSTPRVTGGYTTQDNSALPGSSVPVIVPDWGINTSFTIQKVRTYLNQNEAKLQRDVTFADLVLTDDLYRLIQILNRRSR